MNKEHKNLESPVQCDLCLRETLEIVTDMDNDDADMLCPECELTV